MSWKPLFVAVASCLLLGVACSSQAEGERCDTNNGSDDCESGLVCTASSQLASRPGESTLQQSGQNQTLGLCCPPQPSTAITNPACYPNTTPIGTGGSTGTGGRDAGIAGDSAVKGTGGASGAGGAVATGGSASKDAAPEGGG